MHFGVSNWILGNLCGKDVQFITYYTSSICFECKRELFTINKDTLRSNEGFWMCVGHLKLLTAAYLGVIKQYLQVIFIENQAK